MRNFAQFCGVGLLFAGLLLFAGGSGLTAQVGIAPNPDDIEVHRGYKIEVLARGLNSPTSLAISEDGEIFVAESGFLPGTEARVLKVNSDGTTVRVAPAPGQTFIPPLLGLVVSPDGRLYAGDKGRIVRVEPDGSLTPMVVGLPSLGDHGNNHMAFGPDGKLYFGQGTATNSGVVGLDNKEVTSWLTQHPEVHDLACRDIVLLGRNFTDEEGVTTGAFVPYGTATEPGQIIKGQVPCNGAVLRVDLETGELELVAWGFRNPFGIGFAPPDHPVLRGALLASDNGPDVRGSRPIANAPDELNVVYEGGFYGWPDHFGFLESSRAVFGLPGTETEQGVPPLLAAHPQVIGPVAEFSVGSSADGFAFSVGGAFGLAGDLFIAEWGALGFGVQDLSPSGFKVQRVRFLSNGGTIVSDFIVNKVPGPASASGTAGLEHPIDVKFSSDGEAMYLLDFGRFGEPGTGVLWKVTKKAWAGRLDGAIGEEEYPHMTEVVGVKVYWHNDAEKLYLGLASPGKGYVAIGLDPERQMKGANIILAAVKNGKVETRDDFGTAETSHAPDTSLGGQDNVLEAAGTESAAGTVVEFAIPLDSGDRFDKPLEPGKSYMIIVAYHRTSDSFNTRHTDRGQGRITLEQPE
jgi:glucose/arabinose dehydrogenase